MPKTSSLNFLPFRAGYSRLTKNARQEAEADVFAMRVRDCNDHVAANHELMLAAREGAFEAEGSQSSNQVPPGNRPPGGHQLALATLTVILPSGGIERRFAMRIRTHSSTTSAS